MDRWLATRYAHLLRTAPDPLVVDLGYGARGTTVVELHDRLAVVRPSVDVIGIEIDPERVRGAQPLTRPGVSFRYGGFEVPVDGRAPIVVRAFNVLRQYEEAAVAGAWAQLTQRLHPQGVLIEGTCCELGRRASWVTVSPRGPQTLTLAMRFSEVGRPSDVAPRLPKALIHRNVPGEPVHAFLTAMDAAWERASHRASFGQRQRWIAMCEAVRAQGWPLTDGPSRWRQGEISVQYPAVAPLP